VDRDGPHHRALSRLNAPHRHHYHHHRHVYSSPTPARRNEFISFSFLTAFLCFFGAPIGE
jgi:hypothetical protein